MLIVPTCKHNHEHLWFPCRKTCWVCRVCYAWLPCIPHTELPSSTAYASHTLLIRLSYASYTLLIRFSYVSHTLLIRFSYASHTLLICFLYTAHTPFTRFAYAFHTLLIHFSYDSHTLLIRFSYASQHCSYASHTILMRLSYASHTLCMPICQPYFMTNRPPRRQYCACLVSTMPLVHSPLSSATPTVRNTIPRISLAAQPHPPPPMRRGSAW